MSRPREILGAILGEPVVFLALGAAWCYVVSEAVDAFHAFVAARMGG